VCASPINKLQTLGRIKCLKALGVASHAQEYFHRPARYNFCSDTCRVTLVCIFLVILCGAWVVVVSIIQRSGALRSAESYSKADDAAPIADKGDAQSTRPRVFGKRGLIDKPSTPPNASRHERKSPSFNVTAGMIAVVVIAVVTLPLFFLLFGSTKPGMPFGMASIYRNVSDSAALYRTEAGGSHPNLCPSRACRRGIPTGTRRTELPGLEKQRVVGLRCGRNSPLKGMPANRLGVYRW